MELFVYLCTFNVKSNQLMKNLLLIFIVSVSLISCKKDWTCECADGAGNAVGVNVSAANKSNAENKCQDLNNKGYYSCHLY